VANLAALRAPEEPGLANRVGREVVVVHNALRLFLAEVNQPLDVTYLTEGCRRQNLSLSTGEQTCPVNSRHQANLTRDIANVSRAPAVWSFSTIQDALANLFFQYRVQNALDLFLSLGELSLEGS